MQLIGDHAWFPLHATRWVASILLRDENDFTLAVGLSRFIQEQYGQRWGPFAAGACLPVVALFMHLQRYLVSGLTAGAVKG